ncbi:MAG TPA: 3-oxoacyl-ACP reductase FabG [Roseiarcus sp.]
MFTSLSGRTAIVTGASRGIGRAIALRFGAVGCNVLVVARSGSEADAVAAEITKTGGSSTAVAADVSIAGDAQRMAQAALRRYGAIDLLCANAGIFPASRLDRMTAEEFDQVIGVNLRGAFLSISACLPAMKTRGKGRIVLTSSITGPITGYPGWAHYGASKAGQLGLMRTAAIELAPFNITINAVLPGNIRTEGLANLGADYVAKMEASIPAGRLGSGDDIANTALFFCSDEAAYVTGQTLVVDGGQVLPESLMALEEMRAS